MTWVTPKTLDNLIKLNPNINILKQIKKEWNDEEVFLFIVPKDIYKKCKKSNSRSIY